MQTTLNKIRSYQPCERGWVKLLKHLGKTQADDEPLDFLTILESNWLEDTLWCLKAAPKEWEPNIRMYAVWCAKQVEHQMTDKRSKNALVVAQNHALGLATDDELRAAGAAAWDAARAARDAAWDAAWAAGDAARAARAAAWDAARAAGDAWAAAGDAVWAAAGDVRAAAGDSQKEMFIKMCKGEALWQI